MIMLIDETENSVIFLIMSYNINGKNNMSQVYVEKQEWQKLSQQQWFYYTWLRTISYKSNGNDTL